MALMPISVFAAGLGKLNVNSGLGEPLRADIELLSVTAEELNSISANIASEETYTKQGIERPASHNSIKIEIVKNATGTSVLKLKSTQPINEPFLDMLIQVDWSSGRLLREYTVLLDPPGYVGEQVAEQRTPSSSSQAPVVASSERSGHAVETAGDSKKISRASASKKTSSEPLGETASQEYVTQRGDSLAKIARNLKPEGISLDQMLIGLYRANPNAFDGKNINRLKVGKIIRQPTQSELESVSRQEASNEVKVQSANWNAYRNRLAGIVAESSPDESEANAQSAGGKIKSAAEDQSLPTQAGPKDVVKLSAGEAGLAKKESQETSTLQAKITALQEESTAREKSILEAQEKTAALEKQISDMQKLLALKNNALADVQKQAETQSQEAANAPEPDAVAEAENVAPVEPEKPQPEQIEAPAPAPSTNNNVDKPDAKAPPAPVAAEAAAEPSLLDEVNIPLVGGGLGLLALLGGGWMYLRNKRKRNLADFEQGIMTSGGLKANTVFGNTSGSSVDTGDTSFLTDFSQSANGGMIDTNDVDPIAEAEVYMAYGRDAQAEEILKDAISKEPKRYELHLKLLEMYSASKNVSAFETIAGELYTTLGAADPTWAKVSELGRKLEPNNPLYQASTASADVSEKLDANDFSDSPIANETDLDFSFDNEAVSQDLTPITISNDTFNLDLDDLSASTENADKQALASSVNLEDLQNVEAPALEAGSSVSQSDRDMLDTFLSEILPEQSDVVAPTVQLDTVEPVKEDNGLDFDFGDLSIQSEEPAITKPVDADVASFSYTIPNLDVESADTQKNEVGDEVNLAQQENVAESIEFVSENAEEVSDFNFDLMEISPEDSGDASKDAVVSTFDLSGISLEMDSSDSTETLSAPALDEPSEIETKLDLVAAYLDMGDKEGAKELLEEVMKEGGVNQRKRAEELLVKLA